MVISNAFGMWPFKKKEKPDVIEKSEILAASTYGVPVTNVDNLKYRDFCIDGYMKNPIIARCVKKKATSVSSIPIHLYRKDKEGKEVMDDNHPIKKIIDNPNLRQSWIQFIEEVVSYLSIAGECGIEINEASKAFELTAVRPDNIKIHISKETGLPERYEVETATKGQIFFDFNEVTGECDLLFLKMFNPLDYFRGSSPVKPASVVGDLYNAMNEWNKSTLENGGNPTGIISQKKDVMKGTGGTLSPEQRSRLKEWISSMSGGRNAGKILLLEDGWEWTQMGMSAKDLDFSNSKNLTANDIAMALGVPSQVVGIPGSQTFANFARAAQEFAESFTIPMLRFILYYINKRIIERFDPNVYLGFMIDEVSELSNARLELYSALNNCNFLTINEKRKAAGLPEYEEGGDIADQILINSGLSSVDDLGDLPDEPVEDTPDLGDFGQEENEESEDDESPEEEESGEDQED